MRRDRSWAPSHDESEERSPRTGESGVVPRVAPATVLVADDDDELRNAIAQLLAEDGYQVIQVSSGAGALEWIADAADREGALPDVIVLDFVMPGFSGLGILRAMRQFEHMPPTILVTGFADPSVETFARGLGAKRVLRKPLDEEQLREAVFEAARGASRRG